MAKARKEVGRLEASTKLLSGAVAKLGTVFAGAASINAFSNAIGNASENIDRIGKSADRLGITTEALVGLEHGAGLSGVATEKLNVSLKQFSRLIGEARDGSKSAFAPLKTLGLSLREIEAVPLDEALGKVADRLVKLENPADRTRVAMELFGRSGQEMLTMLSGGSEALEAFQADAEKLGKTFTSLESKKVQKFNDELSRLKDALGGAIQGLVIDVTPAALKAVENLSDMLGYGPNPFATPFETMPKEQFNKLAADVAKAKTMGDLDKVFAKHGFATAETSWSDLALGIDATGKRRNQYIEAHNARIDADQKAALEERTAIGQGVRKFFESTLTDAATPFIDTARNIAKIGADAKSSLGFGAMFDQWQRAALAAPFATKMQADKNVESMMDALTGGRTTPMRGSNLALELGTREASTAVRHQLSRDILQVNRSQEKHLAAIRLAVSKPGIVLKAAGFSGD